VSESAPTLIAALPLWATAQLIADWWSDPTDTETGHVNVPEPVRSGEHSDPIGEVATAAAELLGVDAETMSALSAAIGDPTALAEEYERLLVGPGQTSCPPYESMWYEDAPQQRGIMMGSAAGQVLALYRQAGLTMRPHQGELPDHLVVELEALAWSLEQNRAPAVATALLNDHLLAWLPRFCERVVAETNHPYYRALATLTPTWTAAMADRLERLDVEP